MWEKIPPKRALGDHRSSLSNKTLVPISMYSSSPFLQTSPINYVNTTSLSPGSNSSELTWSTAYCGAFGRSFSPLSIDLGRNSAPWLNHGHWLTIDLEALDTRWPTLGQQLQILIQFQFSRPLDAQTFMNEQHFMFYSTHNISTCVTSGWWRRNLPEHLTKGHLLLSTYSTEEVMTFDLGHSNIHCMWVVSIN